MLAAGISKNQRLVLRCITQPKAVIAIHMISELIRNHLSVFLIFSSSVSLLLHSHHDMNRAVMNRSTIFIAMVIGFKSSYAMIFEIRCNKDNKINQLKYISMIQAPKASSKGRSISCESPPHTYKNPSQNFFQEGSMCSGRESNYI